MLNAKLNYGNKVGYCLIGLGILSLVSTTLAMIFSDRLNIDFGALILIWIGWGLIKNRNGYRIAAIVIMSLYIGTLTLTLVIVAFKGTQGMRLRLGPIQTLSPPLGMFAIVAGGMFVVLGLFLLGLLHHSTRQAFEIASLRRRGVPACISCGYNLTGNVSGSCPECGTLMAKGAV